ncbi:hypothetical protein ES703_54630 [subsurface metagenome]
MKLRINPFNSGNPMNMRDAATVATIIAFATWILNFFASTSIDQVRADVVGFIFEAIKTYAVAWAGAFISLAALEQLIKHRKET